MQNEPAPYRLEQAVAMPIQSLLRFTCAVSVVAVTCANVMEVGV